MSDVISIIVVLEVNIITNVSMNLNEVVLSLES